MLVRSLLGQQSIFRSISTSAAAQQVWHPIKDTHLVSLLSLLTTNAANSQASINHRIFEEKAFFPSRTELSRLIPKTLNGTIKFDHFDLHIKREDGMVLCHSESYDHNHEVHKHPSMMRFEQCVAVIQNKAVKDEMKALARIAGMNKPVPYVNLSAALSKALGNIDLQVIVTELHPIIVFKRPLTAIEKPAFISKLRGLGISVLGKDTHFTPSEFADRIVILNNVADLKRLLEKPKVTALEEYRPRGNAR